MSTIKLVPGIQADVEMLTATEAGEVDAGVDAERDHWMGGGADSSRFVLGTASYVECPRTGFSGYMAEARRTNPILSARFGWLFERLRAKVSEMIGAEAGYEDQLALPGFHVLLHEPARSSSTASVHFDQQYELIDWSMWGHADYERQLSMTLAVVLPASGGGLLVWNVNRMDLMKIPKDARQAHREANRTPEYQAYGIGRLVVHSGHQLHQAASTLNPRPTDRRVTLQAHAVPVDGRWIIYW